MFTGSELATAITAVLAAAVLAGFLLHWVWASYTRAHRTDGARLGEMAARLHEADMAREAAETAAQEAETRLAKAEAELAEKLAAMEARVEGTGNGREAELTAELDEAKRELEVMGDGLSNARRRMMEMEEEIAALKAKKGRKRSPRK